MYIDSPLLSLKQNCPCCAGEGILELYACNNCNKVIAKCDLVHTIFIDPLDISVDKVYEEDPKKCPSCGALDKLRIARDYEIIALGLMTNEYE